MILDKPDPPKIPERGCLWQLVPPQVPLYSNYCSSKPVCATVSCLLFCGSPWNVTWHSYTYGPKMQGASLAALTGGYESWCVKYSHHLILIWPPYREFIKVLRVLLRQCYLDLENSSPCWISLRPYFNVPCMPHFVSGSALRGPEAVPTSVGISEQDHWLVAITSLLLEAGEVGISSQQCFSY